jgi:selenide,water dikinase
MKTDRHPILKDVVLLGAGHAHVEVLRRFGMDPLPGVRLTLITREVHTPYSGMLPGLIAGRYSFDEAHIDTAPLTRFAGARLFRSEVRGIDTGARQVVCSNRPPVPYDVLSIDTGSMPNTATIPGASEHAIPVKPIDSFLGHFEGLLKRVARGGRRRIALVGAGAGGVELILSLEARLRREALAAGRDPGDLSFTLVTASGDVLPEFPRGVRRRFRNLLELRRIDVATNARVTAVQPGALQIEGRAPIRADEILWATQARSPDWLKATGLPLDEGGFLRVGATLQAEGRNDIFAAGDVIAFTLESLPKSGVYAVRTGPVLADNIARTLTRQALSRYKPQREALYLISTGEGEAIGTRSGLVFGGAWAWRWKDRIDRRFMARFNDLPDMAPQGPAPGWPIGDRQTAQDLSAGAMRCGGCGAKVGATALSRTLADIIPIARADVLAGLDAPDDAAILDSGGAQLGVQSVDYFRAIVDDPYIFGKIAANHALGDIFAMGAEPQSALAIATVPYGPEAKVEQDLRALLQGANEVLGDVGCALAGGHSSEGAELALGFTVNGIAERGRVLRKGGMQPGDALILTKPLGTGALLAAHMRGKAKARWVMAALDHMTQSSAEAARILRRHAATAATDITGFGLIGHLGEMVKASGVDAVIALGPLPLLAGLRETLEAGIVSSLQPQNVRLSRAIRNADDMARHPLYPALFDPQTAGGLLASVPAERAADCVAALQGAGYAQACVIGRVQAQSGALAPIILAEGDDAGLDGSAASAAQGAPLSARRQTPEAVS